MTRILSELLEAREPDFRFNLRNLEAASGHLNHDIRLTTELMASSRDQLISLGLDPEDTTGEELYHALLSRLAKDDNDLIKQLRTKAAYAATADASLAIGIELALKEVSRGVRLFSVKQPQLKQFLSAHPPKKLMKALSYRSAQSMLKHEPVALLISAALSNEALSWSKEYRNFLKKLSPQSFEEREVNIILPDQKKWGQLSMDLLKSTRSTVLPLAEAGALILLPFPSNMPKPGLTIATFSQALHSLNDLVINSSYLKFRVVSPYFSDFFLRTLANEPLTVATSQLDSQLPWEALHRRFYHNADDVSGFLPEHVDQLSFSHWQPVEQRLSAILPQLAFWQKGSHCGLLAKHQPVSMNLMDNAINCATKRSYNDRRSHHFQQCLQHELASRYVQLEALGQSLQQELTPALALERA